MKRRNLKQQEKFNKDPMSFFQNQGGGFEMRMGGNQNPQNEAEREKMMEERLKEEAKANNNPSGKRINPKKR